VLGCTEYELAADLIGAALPGTALFGSAAAVAAQALRRASASERQPGAGLLSAPADGTADRLRPAGQGTLRVLLSGRPADLPPAALRYRSGRLLAGLAQAPASTATGSRRPAGLP
jgi:glutamate racemase